MADVEKSISVATDTSASSFHRRMAVADLARAKDAKAVAALASLLGDEDAYVRREVVTGLARIDDPVVIEPLVRALDDEDDYLQRDAADALGRIGDGRAIEPLRVLLEDNSYSVRDAAKRALEKIERRGPEPPPEPPPESPPESAAPRAVAPEVAPTAEARPQDIVEAEPDAGEAAGPATGDEDAEIPIRFDAETEEPVEDDVVTGTVVSATPVSASTSTSPFESPAAPVTPFAEPIVTAEMLPTQTSIVPTERHGEADAVTRRTPAVDTRDWDGARRFQTLFGDAVQWLPPLYTKLGEAESDILQAEQQYRAVLRQLGDVETASHDQLSRLEREIDAANTKTVELRREGTRAKRDKYKAERESSSVAFQLGALFSGEKSRRHRERVKKLDSTIRQTEDQAAKTQEQLKTLQQQHDVLSHPLRELQQQLEALNERRNGAKQALGKAGNAINAWLSNHLQRLSSESLRSRLNSVAELSPEGDLFRVCADELARATSELQALLSEQEQNDVQMQQATAAAEQTTNALGKSIASGFRQTTVEQRANVRLSGSVSFREESGMFSGYSGASGSASGSGTGHASYTVDQLQWSAISDFGQRVSAFTEAWSQCGGRSASGEMLDSLVAACEQRVADLVRLIRAELERDFGGGLV